MRRQHALCTAHVRMLVRALRGLHSPAAGWGGRELAPGVVHQVEGPHNRKVVVSILAHGKVCVRVWRCGGGGARARMYVGKYTNIPKRERNVSWILENENETFHGSLKAKAKRFEGPWKRKR